MDDGGFARRETAHSDYVPQCDCEYQDCESTCGHVAGGCKRNPDVKVRMYGLKANLCESCLQATCNADIFPLEQKLKAEFEILNWSA